MKKKLQMRQLLSPSNKYYISIYNIFKFVILILLFCCLCSKKTINQNESSYGSTCSSTDVYRK